MKKLFVVLLALTVCVAMPLMAQDKEMAKKEDMPAMPAPPAPLDDDFMKWMVGEWKGWSEGAMGKSEVWMKCEMGVGGQFMMTEVKAAGPMGSFTGGGASTLNEAGEIVAFWIDSHRTMATGKGMYDGDTMTVHWESKMGNGTRITKKISNDKFVVTSKMDMGGQVMESKSEMTRVKEMTEKN
ncbi:hypothetical protein IH799_04055 [candidate division KSB1 bacterium]|nr:hypothetical protein [candidate division KSB1 bacterium]